MESSNPVLNNKAFTDAKVFGGGATMTIQGTVNKSLILLAILVGTAAWAWSLSTNPSAKGFLTIGFMGCAIVGFILALATSFKPGWAQITAPIYAACEGVVLGVLSLYFEARYPGIGVQAVGLTFAVTLAMLMGYKAGFLQATPGLRKGMMIAMGGLMLFYVVVWFASMFGVHPPGFISGNSPLGIAFSLLIVGLASMCLILDFDFIESASKQGLEKRMEWYGAFSLMVTLIWLYLEILRLFSKLRRD